LSLSYQTGYMAAFVYSTMKLSRQMITFGTMTVFITMVTQIQTPIVGLSRLLPRVVSIFTSAGRVIEIDGMEAENMEGGVLAPGAVGLEAREVSFAYAGDEILCAAGVQIKPGEFVTMMGSSGIGKTTFVRLAMAYLSPDKGEMALFDGAGGRAVVTAGTRKYISYVPQGNTLISGRIIDNIRLGGPEISEEEIWELLRVVAVDEFVRSAPQGLYTVVGERGLGISEGQAQRIAIARALAKKAPLLILDEATSALDEETEIAVLRHLREHVSGITCLLITHRSSVLRFCDRCIRIDDKQIVDDPSRFAEVKGEE
jgi:ABC-type bacteriocin/lantibiotic exporter with double-glycine peptidase domain